MKNKKEYYKLEVDYAHQSSNGRKYHESVHDSKEDLLGMRYGGAFGGCQVLSWDYKEISQEEYEATKAWEKIPKNVCCGRPESECDCWGEKIYKTLSKEEFECPRSIDLAKSELIERFQKESGREYFIPNFIVEEQDGGTTKITITA